MIDFNAKAKEIFDQNKAVGWWDDMNRCFFTTLQLVNTEIAEATEGVRKDLMDDHLPHRKMEEVELADALIRILDLGARCGWVYDEHDDDVKRICDMFNIQNYQPGLVHYILTSNLCQIGDEVDFNNPYDDNNGVLSIAYSIFICLIVQYSESRGYDIIAAMDEKLEYNKQRADHKRENREQTNGKKF